MSNFIWYPDILNGKKAAFGGKKNKPAIWAKMSVSFMLLRENKKINTMGKLATGNLDKNY